MKKSVLLALLAIISIVFIGCSKDGDGDSSISLKASDVTVYSGDKYQIEATSEKNILYQSENEYYAKVSTSGLITSDKVGETNILLTNGDDTKSIRVTVKGKSNIYPEPKLEWGITKSNLIKSLGIPNKETSEAIIYDNYSTAAPSIIYIFDDNNKLKSIGVLVKSSYSASLGTFLAERYVALASQDYTIYFVNGYSANSISMGVGAMLYNTSYWIVAYMPYSAKTKSTQSENSDFIKIVDDIMDKS